MKKLTRTCSDCSRTYQLRFYAECPCCEHLTAVNSILAIIRNRNTRIHEVV